MRTESISKSATAAAEFVDFFTEGWAIGATHPERFYAHISSRLADDALMVQPLARDVRGPAGLRELFAPLFAALPDLTGTVVRWGETRDGVIIHLDLSSPSTGLAWTTLDEITLRDGVIASRQAHFDPLPLMLGLARRPRVAAKLLPSLLKR